MNEVSVPTMPPVRWRAWTMGLAVRGFDPETIAATLGGSPGEVRLLLAKRRPVLAAEREAWALLYREGFTIPAIAEASTRGISTIWWSLQKAGCGGGKQNKGTSPEMVAEARRRLEELNL